jgi:hypothetical protein
MKPSSNICTYHQILKDPKVDFGAWNSLWWLNTEHPVCKYLDARVVRSEVSTALSFRVVMPCGLAGRYWGGYCFRVQGVRPRLQGVTTQSITTWKMCVQFIRIRHIRVSACCRIYMMCRNVEMKLLENSVVPKDNPVYLFIYLFTYLFIYLKYLTTLSVAHTI